MGGRGFNFFVGCGVVLVVAVALLQEAAAQTEHVVGNGTGWLRPPSTSFYSDWASSKTFRVGDKLVFNFVAGSHDVATASKPDFDSCNTGIPDGSIQRTSPVNVTLNATGQHYYYCTFTGHCLAGQKLAINVVGGGAVTPPPPPGTPPATGTSPPPPSATGTSPPPPSATGPSPPPPPPSSPSTDAPPPPPSSAPSLAVAGLFVTFLSIVVGLLL